MIFFCYKREYENILNQHYVTKAPDGIVQLVTRNQIREEINKKNLEKINGKEYCYNAEIFYNPNIKYKREVNPKDYMCDFELKLKVGAHIMMVANDKDKRWVNGTFGTISELGNDYIKVLIDDNEYTVEKYEFIKYKCYYNKNEKKLIYIEENCVKQFPVILAYAVTIHKSQGMTYQEYDYSTDIPDSIDPTYYMMNLEDSKYIYQKAGYRVVEIPSYMSLSKIKEAFDKKDYTYIKHNKTKERFRSYSIANKYAIDNNTVYEGSIVKVLDMNFDEEYEYELVHTSEIDLSLNKISTESPIGKALLGKKVNQEIEVNTPSGIIKLKILKII